MLDKIVPKSKVIVRADLDVPIKDGQVSETYRLEKLLPTLNTLLQQNCQVLLIGHLGRPDSSKDAQLSLKPIQNWLEKTINLQVPMYVSGFSPGEWWIGGSPLSMIDNIRFFPGEENMNREFAKELSTGADFFVYEAFASYRPSTSTHILPELLPSCSGLQFDLEISTLSKILQNPEKPTLLIASGAKKDKLEIISMISTKFDQSYLGGLLGDPQDLSEDTFDISDMALATLLEKVSQARTIVYNGPLGRFEDGTHTKGTKTLLGALKRSTANTILGGGDTLASIPYLGFDYTDYRFVSTGGGAMLEFLATGKHPVQEKLVEKS